MSRQHWALLRLLAVALLVWAAWAALVKLRRAREPWPPGEALLGERAARRAGAEAGKLAGAWREQLAARERALAALRRALRAEPRPDARRRAARRVLAHLDSGRGEKDLHSMARLGPAARRLEYPKRMGPLVAGSRVDPAALGSALGELARQRFIDRAARPEAPLVLDEFRAELLEWLVGGG